MTCLLAFTLAAWAAQSPLPAFDGTAKQVTVAIPRIDAGITVDGALSETEWNRAATLSGFSQYTPVDARRAEHRTEVLVWYSPTAIHFGIRAFADASTIRATLAQRDRIDTDDAVEIYLGTFNDRRQALLFGVNPLGVQVDGALVEGAAGGQRGGFGGLAGGREAADLSQDFIFDSKGRVTAWGYEVEVRIPFKTLRYQPRETQDWALHIIRRVQQTGHEDSWVPASRNAASFLSQSGTLTGLTGLRRGLVLDVTPVVTARADGVSGAEGWGYDTGRPDFGANVRWGVTSNLTLNGTINPDFSQVEADATQFVFDPRQAISFQEKRPFFLDGIEQFATPNNLIYTRAIVAPLGAAKLTGKVRGTSVGVLTAVDDDAVSRLGGNHPFFAIARVQRDLPGNARVALVYTDRTEDGASNRVIGVDTRVPLAGIYTIDAQAAVSRDRIDAPQTAAGTASVITAPLWQVAAARNGRRYSFRYQARGIDDDFRTRAGFISRAGVMNVNLVNQLAFYGPQGSWFARYTGDVTLDGLWRYAGLVDPGLNQERKLHFNHNVLLRGGWRAGVSVLVERFGYDSGLYANHRLVSTAADGSETYQPFTGTPTLPNLDWLVSAGTPRVKGLQGNFFYLRGRDENYFEWASGDVVYASFNLQWRPTERFRTDLSYVTQTVKRPSDGSEVSARHVPRARVEYQLTRAVSFRWIGEYASDTRDDLRDDSRTNLPLAVYNPSTGAHTKLLSFQRRSFRSDVLFSWVPAPGTVFYAGYGSAAADAGRPSGLARVSDGFFIKLSYLFRI
ncbi:MAG: carbohydrate binding family 9 domain-containing protein [Acidobacteriota bacterium]|nr:carbohydrate binding family 9 domain-containing protein [Acidobacteriota bacterium]